MYLISKLNFEEFNTYKFWFEILIFLNGDSLQNKLLNVN